MSRIPIIAANWKMHLLQKEARELARSVAEAAGKTSGIEVILFPGFLTLPAVAETIHGSKVSLGGQNMHFEEMGAFTGEVSAEQLKDAGCSHVLIGHSERRHYFNEDYETVNRKVKRALSSGLQVMLCVGESLEEREKGITEMVVVDQLESAFDHVAAKELKNIAIAYEPIWAIGTGKTATPEDANHVHAIIRKTLTRIFKAEEAARMRILYGGSVKPDNIADLMKQEHIDGALVGGASLKADSFRALIHYDK